MPAPGVIPDQMARNGQELAFVSRCGPKVAAFGPFGEAKDNYCVRQACAALEQLIQRARTSDCQVPSSSPLNVDLYALAVKLYCDGLCQKECFILAYIYGQRLLKKPSFGLMSAENVYRFFLVSVMVASKFLDDMYCRNSYFAAAGGMSTAELNALELRFCFLMDFRLAVDAEEYDACVSTLMADSSSMAPPLSSSLFSAPLTYPATMAPAPMMAPQPPPPVQYRAYPIVPQPALYFGSSCALPPTFYPSVAPLPAWPLWDPARIWMPLPPGGAVSMAPDHRLPVRADPLGAASAWFAHCPTA